MTSQADALRAERDELLAALDNRHHAHTPITAADWSDLHAAIGGARIAIANAEREPAP